MRTSLRLLITLVVVLLALAAGAWLWHYYLYTPWTRDGRVAAHVVTVSPDVSGWIDDLVVDDSVQVEQGQILFKLNTARYEAAVNKAEAEVANRKAQLELKRHEENRRSRLSNRAISKEDLEVSRINTRLAQAELAKAEALLQDARLDLERTAVKAPAAGYILNLQLTQGDYVSRSQPIMALVKTDSFYVIGYFEETKMARIHLGDVAHVLLMNGDTRLKGHVSGIARGIADDNQQLDAQLLPQVEPTFSWVRLAQRIPVRITLDDVPEDILLSAGMSASVRIIDDPDLLQK
nr:efflux RND transporter periplasmic adaptor subunit [uncultured Halomonas sp.]